MKINGTLVEETDSTKYLGTFIDNKLTWKKTNPAYQNKTCKGDRHDIQN